MFIYIKNAISPTVDTNYTCIKIKLWQVQIRIKTMMTSEIRSGVYFLNKLMKVRKSKQYNTQ